MPVKRGPGIYVFFFVCLAAAAVYGAARLGYFAQLRMRLFPRVQPPIRLSSGDFPAGVAAPVGDFASVPIRPTLIGFVPRGSSAALLLATGGASSPSLEPRLPERPGLFKKSYAMDARALVYSRDEELRRALALGAEGGGVDMAILTVDRLALWAISMRDAAPRTVLLVGRSLGQEAIAAVGISSINDLRDRRLAAYLQGSCYYFGLWALSRARLAVSDVQWVELTSDQEAGLALRDGRADAVIGLLGDVELAARDRGGKILATSQDAPHLIASVLIARGEFVARYPDAMRRVIRGLIDASSSVLRDPVESARLLGEVAPHLGDPIEAIKNSPPATSRENLAFFGLSGEAPVTYDELYQSAAGLFVKMGRTTPPPPAEETRDLGPLKYVVEARPR